MYESWVSDQYPRVVSFTYSETLLYDDSLAQPLFCPNCIFLYKLDLQQVCI